ncbi:MAG: alpha/beta hydrolase, partial [Caulobacteraceae bacterium]
MTLAETSLFEDPDCRTTTAKPLARERGGARDVIVPIPADFRLASGERLNQPNIVGRLHGRIGAPVVVVAGGISAGRFVHRTETNGLGWWSGAVSVRGPIDLSRFQVLAVDFAPGAEFLETPVTITTHDQARLLGLVLTHLKIERVSAFVGCSYGGMVGLAFAELFPDWAE